MEMKDLAGVNFQDELNPRMEEIELMNEGEEEKVEEEEKIDPKELESLRKKAEANDAYKDSLRMLSEKLEGVGKVTSTAAPVNVMPQQPYESDEQFAKRIEDELFKSGNTLKALREVVGKEVAPVINHLQSITVQQSRKLMELDPEKGTYFKKYAKDIDEVVNSLPAQQRVNPAVYEWAPVS